MRRKGPLTKEITRRPDPHAHDSNQTAPWETRRRQPRRAWALLTALAACGIGLGAVLAWRDRLLRCSPEAFTQGRVAVDRPTNVTFDSAHPVAPWAVFYNIFVPADQGRRGVARAVGIVEEQLRQIAASDANRLRHSTTDPFSRLTIYYATVGLPGVVTPAYMHRACTVRHNLTCTHLGHHSAGFEEHSLEPLHRFCRERADAQPTGPFNTTRVVYLHSKGAFHTQRGENDHWRRHMMRAVLDRRCLAPPPGPPGCNVCGLLFQPVWAPFFPGNFWTADCRHVARLLPPLVHRTRLRRLLEGTGLLAPTAGTKSGNALVAPPTSRWRATLFETGPGYLGVDRYASEHWIAGHPDVVPCDLSATAALERWWQGPSEVDEMNESLLPLFEWRLAPRHSVDAPYFRLNHSRVAALLADPVAARREYFWLPGLLHRTVMLYGRPPPPESWVWRWFPDAAEWQRALAPYGNRTVEVATASDRNGQ